MENFQEMDYQFLSSDSIENSDDVWSTYFTNHTRMIDYSKALVNKTRDPYMPVFVDSTKPRENDNYLIELLSNDFLTFKTPITEKSSFELFGQEMSRVLQETRVNNQSITNQSERLNNPAYVSPSLRKSDTSECDSMSINSHNNSDSDSERRNEQFKPAVSRDIENDHTYSSPSPSPYVISNTDSSSQSVRKHIRRKTLSKKRQYSALAENVPQTDHQATSQCSPLRTETIVSHSELARNYNLPSCSTNNLQTSKRVRKSYVTQQNTDVDVESTETPLQKRRGRPRKWSTYQNAESSNRTSPITYDIMQKKKLHNEMERDRRNVLKELTSALIEEVPSLKHKRDSTKKEPVKREILEATLNYIKELQNEHDTLTSTKQTYLERQQVRKKRSTNAQMFLRSAIANNNSETHSTDN